MRKYHILASAMLICSLLFSACNKEPYDPAKDPNKETPEKPASEWTTFEHEGFKFNMKTVEVDTKDGKAAIEHLKKNLTEINGMIPENALKVMKQRIIWLERDLTDGAAWYHVNKEWLISQGYMVEKWHCVELCNFVHYVSWSKQNQPYMVLHELCHLYHDLGVPGGYQNADILKAYNHAKSSGMYKGTPYRYNTTDPKSKWSTTDAAYCLNDQMEYFSEMCEAYWGENDYYPFNYEQLKEYDPMAFEVMEKIWGKRPDKN